MLGTKGLCGMVVVLVAGLTGCEAMPPRGPVDLRDARITAVELAPGSGVPRICPGSDVPLSLDVDAVLPGQDEVRHLRAQRRRYDDWIFDPRDLHVTSPDGVVGDDLVLHTSADPLITATHGFLVNVRAPGGPSFGLRYMPSYDCVKRFGREAPAGQPGANGAAGMKALSANGGDVGETGATGGAGGAGPVVTLYATYVSTPYYPKLLAVVAEDGHEAFALANPGASLVLEARGGDGGAGGRGGSGGDGSTGDICIHRGRKGMGACKGWQSWNPGPGGVGGVGGEGGPGGQLVLHVDARYPDIAEAMVLDVHGGDGGSGGPGGSGGEPASDYRYQDHDHVAGESSHGPPGAAGAFGAKGSSGTATVLYDDVAPRFQGRPGITVLPST